MKILDGDDVRAQLRRRADEVGTQRALAESLDMEPTYLCDIINGRRPLPRKLLAQLGLCRVVVYMEVEAP